MGEQVEGVTFGERVRARRAALGVLQADLAARVGISERQLRNIETGFSEPTLRLAMDLARELGASLAELAQAE